MSILQRADEASKWSVLKAIGGSYVGGLTILTPVFGYLLLVPGVQVSVGGVEVIEGFSVTAWGGEMSSSSRLLYLGLFILGIATMIFRASCPTEIAKYKDEVEFTTAEKGVYSAHRLSSDLKYVLSLSHGTVEKSKIDALEKIEVTEHKKVRDTLVRLKSTEWWEQFEPAANMVLPEIYKTKDRRFPVLRILMGIAYAIGLGLTLIPSFKTFCSVLVLPWFGVD